jgi:hypothetical protein
MRCSAKPYLVTHPERISQPREAGFVYAAFKSPGRTAKKAQHFTVTKINWLTLFKEINAVYGENYVKPRNTPYGQNAELLEVKADVTSRYRCALKGSK